MRRNAEESIYQLANMEVAEPQQQGAPKIRMYPSSAPAGHAKIRMHEDSSQIESFLNPTKGIRDAQKRAGAHTPKRFTLRTLLGSAALVRTSNRSHYMVLYCMQLHVCLGASLLLKCVCLVSKDSCDESHPNGCAASFL